MLAVAGLVAVRASGVRSGSALALFAVAAGLVLLARLTGRRRRVFWIEVADAPEVDPGIAVLGPLATAARAAFPSTVGLTVLIVISLIVNAPLAAFLAGALAGLAVTAAVSAVEIALWERRNGRQILLHRSRVYVN